MAKHPNDRYKSAYGVNADLEICRDKLRSMQELHRHLKAPLAAPTSASSAAAAAAADPNAIAAGTTAQSPPTTRQWSPTICACRSTAILPSKSSASATARACCRGSAIFFTAARTSSIRSAPRWCATHQPEQTPDQTAAAAAAAADGAVAGGATGGRRCGIGAVDRQRWRGWRRRRSWPGEWHEHCDTGRCAAVAAHQGPARQRRHGEHRHSARLGLHSESAARLVVPRDAVVDHHHSRLWRHGQDVARGERDGAGAVHGVCQRLVLAARSPAAVLGRRRGDLASPALAAARQGARAQ
jgi:hypothetical protein